MKKILLIVLLLLVAWTGDALAVAASCSQSTVTKSGAMASVTFTCTADSTNGSYLTTGTAISNSAVTAAIRGYYVSEVLISPGGAAPTDGTAVTIKTADSPAWDILGGIGVCSATITKRYPGAAVTLPSGTLVSKTIDTSLTVSATGNSVSSAIIIVKIIMWKN